MGLELRLNVTEQDIAGFYANPESRAALLASHKGSKPGQYFHPVLRTPLATCMTGFIHPIVAGVFREWLGDSKFPEFLKALDYADVQQRALLNAVIEGRAADYGLVPSLYSQLQVLAATSGAIGQIDTREITDKVLAGFLDVRNESFFQAIIYANEMYNPATWADFLKRVKESSVERECQSGMLAVLRSAGIRVTPEAVKSLFISHREELIKKRFAADDLFATPLTAVETLNYSTLKEALVRALGENDYGRLGSMIQGGAATWKGMVEQLGSRQLVSRPAELGNMVEDHVSHLAFFKNIYVKASEADAGNLPPLGQSMLRVGLGALANVVATANALYCGWTQKELLARVDRGMVKPSYRYGMLAAARSIVPKTL